MIKMCILNKYKHTSSSRYCFRIGVFFLIDMCHFMALGICLSKGYKACVDGTKHLLNTYLLYFSVNYMSYLFKLSDATMDCSASYIKAFRCKKSHLFTSFQLRQTFYISFTHISCGVIIARWQELLFSQVYPT